MSLSTSTSMVTSSAPSVPSSSSSMMANLPELAHITAAQLTNLRPPRPRIRTELDLQRWRSTPSYAHLQLYLSRLTATCVDVPLHSSLLEKPSSVVQALIAFLDQVEHIAEGIPPLPTPQRYGNLAFRTFGHELLSSLPPLLSNLLPDDLRDAIPFLTPHLLSSFGNFTRMDYGTGHELSFLLFLLTLSLLRFLHPTQEEERHVALLVFPRYIRVCWALQDRYRLEPAGSHGVWGLDDYHFLPYMFGAAQLLDSDLPPSYVLSLNSASPRKEPTNLYELMILRVLKLKTGPFHEHSPQLHSIASGVLRWQKVGTGLRKMYDVEVLGKRVVVQHIALGGVLEWDWKEEEQELEEVMDSEEAEDRKTEAEESGMDGPTNTAAPWAAAAQRTSFPLTWESSLPAPARVVPYHAVHERVDDVSTIPAWPTGGEELPPPPKISAGRAVKNPWGA